MNRTVAALRLPHLPLAAVRRAGAVADEAPLVVVQQGRVVDLNRAARRLGAHPGLAVDRLHPALIIRPRRPEWEARIRRVVAERLLDATPLVAERDAGQWLVELSGTRGVHRAAETVTWDRVLRDLENDLKVTPLSGIGGNPAMARMAETAARRAHMRLLRIFPGQEQRFLAPLPVTVLPGVGTALAKRLHRLGLTSVGHLVRCPEERLVRAFGKRARLWRAWGLGHDTTPIQPTATVAEPTTITLHPGIHRQKDPPLRALLVEACNHLGLAARRERVFIAVVTLELEEWDGPRHRRKIILDPPEDRTMGLLASVWDGLHRLRSRRVLIRRLTLTVTETRRYRDENLFAPLERSSPLLRRGLDETLDAIRGRFGAEAVRIGPPP